MQSQQCKSGARRILAVALFLLAGALTSIALAWTIELRLAWRGVPQDRPGDTFWYPAGKFNQVCTLYRDFGYREYHVSWTFSGELDASRRKAVPSEVPGWVRRPDNRLECLSGTCSFGFPFPCMKWDYTDLMETPSTTTNQIEYQSALRLYLPTRYAYARLPVRPLAAGLVANSAICASLLFLLTLFPRILRRHLRLRRGHCPACNYDLRGQSTLCPECGRTALLSSSQ
jgi:hypothetical protein